MASSSETWKSREAFKKAKELDEARKAGNAPAELDEEGREINPHIPQYILKQPWYDDNKGTSLRHQRHQAVEGNKIGLWYNKGAKLGESAQKYRKGACENCGAMTHQTKDCCERPRKVGAKYNGADIKPDEVVETLNLSYDAKRDPYNGYDSDSYKEIMDLYEKAEQERKKKKLQELMQQHQNSLVEGGDGSGSVKPTAEELSKQLQEQEEQDNYSAETIAPIQKLDPKSRTTIRNLRIREDIAKYLYNLDVDSSFYEPKSRSMRENPLANSNSDKDIGFLGDNFTRTTGDTQKFRDMQMFAWEAHDKGQDIDVSSAPTQAALLHKEFQAKKEQLRNQSKKIILSKYGGEEHLLENNKEGGGDEETKVSTSVPSTEIYTEYSANGKLLKGQELLTKSKYEEDVYLNNHTSIWGSYWEDGHWGFQCCKQLIKNTYCTGEHGRKLKEKQLQNNINNNNNSNTEQNEVIENNNNNDNNNVNDKKDKKEKKKSLKKAIKEQEELNRKDVKDFDERKMPYNSLKDNYNVTKEEMDAYSLKRKRGDDPMLNYQDNSDLDE
ncbi:putative RNA splicing factor [Tieghemostelium lacteum]|uniref:Pre-mRNA-splicing factor SLU7 n=1 Tax=Tieghemostelium lacteum TaxID=361077 RepID=A0A151ZIP8_TIELA|nr:putative RNA splicing factor [Tieghemostelium lacteum]|eukprot:KYQ93760.1 putative RNA splicing factor [Tieghemostelium lacteum]